MATVGTLALNLEARTAKLERDMKKFRGEVARSSNHVKKMADQTERSGRRTTRAFSRMSVGANGMRTSIVAVSRAMKGLAAIAIGGLALRNVINVISETDSQLQKVSQRLGVTAEDWQELRFAASQTGIQMQVLTLGFQRLIRRAQDAVSGNEKLREAFARVGLSVEQLRTLSNKEIFLRAITGAAQLKNGLLAIQKLADSEAVALLQMGQAGRQGLSSMMQRARELGLVLTNELVRKSAEANDLIDIMQRVIKVHLTRAILKALPQIISFGNSFTRVVTALTGTNKEMLKLTFNESNIVKSIQSIAKAAESIFVNFFKATDAVGKFIAKFTADSPNKMLGKINDRIRTLRHRIELVQKFGPGAAGPFAPRSLQVLERQLQNALSARKVIQEEMARQTETGIKEGIGRIKMDIVYPGGRGQPPPLGDGGDGGGDGGDGGDGDGRLSAEAHARNTVQMFRRRLELQKAANERRLAEERRVQEKFREISERSLQDIEARGKQAFEKMSIGALALQAVVQGIVNGFSSAIDGVIRGTQSLGDAFRNMFRNIMLSIADLLIQFGLILAMLTVINALPGGPAFLKAMDAAAIASSGGVAGQAAFATFQKNQGKKFAQGGVVNRPTLGMLGENPATRPEYVLNRQQMEGMNREVNVILVDDRMSAEKLRAELPGAIIRTVSENMLAGPGNSMNRSVRQGLGRG